MAFCELFPDPHRSAYWHEIEQIDHIMIAHAHAAMTARAADAVFVIRAVDLDVALKGVRIAWFQAVEPKDAGEHEIGLGVHSRSPVTDGLARFENRAAFRSIAMFLLYDKTAQRRFVTAFGKADAEFGCRAGPFFHQPHAIEQTQALCADADFEARVGESLHIGFVPLPCAPQNSKQLTPP